jgi:hypothetical protein
MGGVYISHDTKVKRCSHIGMSHDAKVKRWLSIWTHSAKATQALGSWGRIEDFLVSNDATTALQKQLL